MTIYDIGYNHKHKSNFRVDRPDGCDNWLLLIIKTAAVFLEDGNNKKIHPNAFVIYEPYFPHSYRADDGEYADDWFHFFLSEEEQKLFEILNIPLNKVIELNEIAELSLIVRSMCYEFWSNNTYRTDSNNLYFRILLNKLSERTAWSRASFDLDCAEPYLNHLLHIRSEIYKRPGQPWDIDELAAEFSISRSRFQHVYSKTFGINIMQDIITSRMEYAARLLRTTSITISEIAQMSGYSSSSYFMRQFKARFGVTPSFYRSSNHPVKL